MPKYNRIQISFELSQARVNNKGYSSYQILQNLAQFLNVNVNEIRNDRKHPQYRVRTNTVKSNLILSNYLDQFKLQGTKYLDYQDWKSILNYFEEGNHYKNISKIIEIKRGMNHLRKEYN